MSNNLKRIRNIRGVTQEEVARAIGVSRVTVAGWEAGRVIPHGRNREKLADYYGIDCSELFRVPSGAEISAEIHSSVSDLKTSFLRAVHRYVQCTETLIASSAFADLECLEAVLAINGRMGQRLKALLDVQAQEQNCGGTPVAELLCRLGAACEEEARSA